MINSIFDPANKSEYTKYKLEVNNIGVRQECSAGQVTNIDLTPTDDVLLVGLMVGFKNHADGDYVHLEIHHPIEGLKKRFVTNWQVFETVQIQMSEETVFPAKIPAGLIIRLVYTSTGEATVVAKINYKLHKVLV